MKRSLQIILISFVVFSLTGTAWFTYVKTGWRRAVDTVKENVPISFEIDRARMMVQDLDTEVRKNIFIVAKEEVEVARIADKVAESTRTLSQAQKGILTITDDLARNQEFYEYSGKRYSIDAVKKDLSARFERFKNSSADHDALAELLQGRRRNLGLVRKKLEQLNKTKYRLGVKVEHLEGQLALLEVSEATNELSIDATKLRQARALIANIAVRMDVAARVRNFQFEKAEIELAEPLTENIVEEVTEYFQEARGTSVATKP